MALPGWRWNYKKQLPPDSGCRACEYNELGVCSQKNREIPFTYALQNRRPVWCPYGGKRNDGRGKK